MPQPKRKKEPRARARKLPSADRPLFAAAMVLATLALLPTVFTRTTVENFEFPKTELLLLLTLPMLAWWVAGEFARLSAAGPARWIAELPSRVLAAARSDPAGAAILLFLLSAVASTIGSINPRVSLHGAADSYAGLPVAFATASVYFASRVAAREPSTLDRLGLAVAWSAAIASGYALLQLLNLDPIEWHRTASFGGAVRIFGTLGHPNLLGAYLAMALPLVAWRATRANSPAARIALLVIVASSISAIVATLSRGTWLAFAASGAVWVALRARAARAAIAMHRDHPADGEGGRAPRPGARRRTAAGIAILAIALLAPTIWTLGPSLAQRFREIGSASAPTTRSRIEIWRAGLRMAADHPVLGVGVDAFASAFPGYRTVEYWRIEMGATPGKAHNEPIHILATQGMLGGLAALLIVLFTVRAVWCAAGSHRAAVRQEAAAAGAALAAFAVQGLTSFTTVATGTLAAAALGWVAVRATEARPAGDAARTAAPRRSLVGFLVGGVVAAALFVPLVLSPWRAERTAFDALTLPQTGGERYQGLSRAARIAPWDARYPAQMGLGILTRAINESDAEQRWILLEDAARSYTRALAIAPELTFERACLGRTLAEQSRLRPTAVPLDSALAQLNEALRRDPVNATVMMQHLDALMEIHRESEAHAVALRIATMYPQLGTPFANLGLIALREGRNQDAADTLRLAVTKAFYGEESRLVNAWSNLSAAYVFLKRYPEAVDAAERALAIDPENQDALRNRAEATSRLAGGGG